jgi:hypothetical protein
MSKVLISSLIDEINLLLSRPVGSVSRKVSPDAIHQRDQLKQLRSHLENLTDDAYLNNLDQQYQPLLVQLKGSIQEQNYSNSQPPDDITAKSDLITETSIMMNDTPEPNSTFINDRLIATLQQAIQQTLQQVVKDSVQQTVQQVVSQTLAVERALMVGEISANLNKIVENQQRSQLSQELVTLNQQKQKLNAEISQLESDRANWMKQFQEFQTAQQDALDQSSVITAPVATPPKEEEFVQQVQAQTDRFLLNLDQMFNSTFRSLEQDIQGYQTSIEIKIGYMETLEQKGEALINALVDRIGQQSDNAPTTSQTALINTVPELPDDIPVRYLETVPEPADEDLINALLAGNEFGEAIAEPMAEPVVESIIEVPIESATIEESITVNFSELEGILDAPSDTLFESSIDEIEEIDFISDSDGGSDSSLAILDPNVIEGYQSAIAARALNPDFDIEAATQIVESFDFRRNDEETEGNNETDLQSLALHLEAMNEAELIQAEQAEAEQAKVEQTIDDPELLQWLEDSSNRPSPANITEVSADEELMSWLGNDAIDMAKLPTQEEFQSPIAPDLISPEPALFNTSPITANSPSSISLDTINESQDDKVENQQIEQFLSYPISDQAEDSEESLILLCNQNEEDSEFPEWEDSLVNELSSDLQRLDEGVGADPLMVANLDQFIRNTPYALTNWETEESQIYPTIIEVSAKESNGDSAKTQSLIQLSIDPLEVPPIIENPHTLFMDGFAESFAEASDIPPSIPQPSIPQPSIPQNKWINEELEIVVEDVTDLRSSPFATASSEIPEIFDNPESLFDSNTEEELPVKDSITTSNPSAFTLDDMDAIFADVIAKNAAKHTQSIPQSTPFTTNGELDELFVRSTETDNLLNADLDANLEMDLDLDDDSELDTLLFGFDPLTEIEQVFNNVNDDPNTASNQNSAQIIEEELDTILHGFAQNELSNPSDSSDVTKFVAIEESPTVLENFSSSINSNINQSNDWNSALERFEAKINQPITDRNPQVSELSADEFFASLEYEKLNNLADRTAKTIPEVLPLELPIASLITLENNLEDEGDDLLLNEFADAQGEVLDNDWDNLLNDLNSFNFNEPLLDDRREQLGLSSVAPITDTSENVLDIDSLVMESHTKSLIAPPPEKEIYSLDDTWILGVDFGSTAIRASLLNSNTGKVYPLHLDDGDEMLCKVVWTADQSLDDPMSIDIRVLTKKSPSSGLENGELAISHFKQFLKLGLPYRGVSAWQPIIQWSNSHQASLRWLIAALKNLLEQIQTRSNHPQLPDLGLILLKLSGVVFGYPSDWSDTYILNVREAILKAGLVHQSEQVMAVEQAIAPILSLIHEQKISQEITLIIDSGAVTTSLCLTKGVNATAIARSTRSSLHIRSFEYAGISISQDIIVQLFYPHWQLITNPNRHLCKFDHLSLPEIGSSAPEQRILLQQYLLSSDIGQQMLELADRVKVTFRQDVGVDSWNEDLMGQPIVVFRRELENLILQPFIQRLNRELNAVMSNAGLLGEDVRQILMLGSTMQIPLLSRWLTQKLPHASIDFLATSIVANGLAVAPLYPNLQDVARQQYSDYFLLQEICRLNLTQSANATQLLQQLQMRGINTKVCRDRILTILQGDLPEGLFPWQEAGHAVVLEDPTLSSELFTGRLFELETDGTYQPNVTKFQQLRVYLQAIIGNMSQTLNEPLVFPEIKKH